MLSTTSYKLKRLSPKTSKRPRTYRAQRIMGSRIQTNTLANQKKAIIINRNGNVQIDSSHPDYDYWMED